MPKTNTFPNIENTAVGRGRRLLGYARSGRAFRIAISTKRMCRAVWLARAITSRTGLVNEFRAPTLAEISERLTHLD